MPSLACVLYQLFNDSGSPPSWLAHASDVCLALGGALCAFAVAFVVWPEEAARRALADDDAARSTTMPIEWGGAAAYEDARTPALPPGASAQYP